MKRSLILLMLITLATAFLAGCSNNNHSDEAQNDVPSFMDDEQKWELSDLTYYDENGAQIIRLSYRYNSHGTLCRYELYDENDVLFDATTWDYIYLDDGRVDSIYINGGDIYSSYTDNYDYDQSGKIAYISRVYDDGSKGSPMMKAFDEEGRIIEEADGTYQWYYTYGDNENREMRYYVSDDSTMLTVRKFNSDNKIEEIREYAAEGFENNCTEDNLCKYIVYDFDEYGRRQGYQEFAADGTLAKTAAYAYEEDGHSFLLTGYDNKGNVINSIHYIYLPIAEITE